MRGDSIFMHLTFSGCKDANAFAQRITDFCYTFEAIPGIELNAL